MSEKEQVAVEPSEKYVWSKARREGRWARVTVTGVAEVEATCWYNRYLFNSYCEGTPPVLGIEQKDTYRGLKLQPCGMPIALELLPNPYMPRFHAMAQRLHRACHACLVFFDLTDPHGLSAVQPIIECWYSSQFGDSTSSFPSCDSSSSSPTSSSSSSPAISLREEKEDHFPALVLVGTKMDLQWAVTKEQIIKTLQSLDEKFPKLRLMHPEPAFVPISSRTGHNVSHVVDFVLSKAFLTDDRAHPLFPLPPPQNDASQAPEPSLSSCRLL